MARRAPGATPSAAWARSRRRWRGAPPGRWRAARGHGAEIQLDAGVREVIVENDRAVGVILDNGDTVRAKYVVSGVNPKLLYTRLIPANALPEKFLERIGSGRSV